ncbi:putative DegT/DnrJ/EryC1/StrS aminotransferase [Magnetofaba australis IT-1]|uniref:Putative DegT/DnrJ/EryC1/StrS aminotransferase n=1 Tax=Magnetofaba australis IT-1 TaxID=1434232 RepID=A0A1Y2K6M8_9PROT|nr:putative DegT/DnrJ/EryC1/StrS aminotransferase [Magnetofaba australis IT-1]
MDINPRTLAMDEDQVLAKINDNTRAVFLTHAQGFNGLSDRLVSELEKRGVPLIEDVCESHGATHKGKKLGSIGLASNFSFYFAHHMSTIEGGMVCTNDEAFYNAILALRSHGMTREIQNDEIRQKWIDENPELSPDFIFAYPAINTRNTEIGAVLGRSALPRLDANNALRTRNFTLLIKNLDPNIYFTDFVLEGSSNYAFNLILKEKDPALRDRLEKKMRDEGVEFRRGSAGGGNQVRQPYVRPYIRENEWLEYPEVEHIHYYGYYVGNYPSMSEEQVLELCKVLNSI